MRKPGANKNKCKAKKKHQRMKKLGPIIFVLGEYRYFMQKQMIEPICSKL